MLKLTLSASQRNELAAWKDAVTMLEDLLPKGYYWDGLGDITFFVSLGDLDQLLERNPGLPPWFVRQIQSLRGGE